MGSITFGKRVRVSSGRSSTSELRSFDFKYYNLKYNLFDVLNKLLLKFMSSGETPNMMVVNSIFKFYSELNSAFQVQEVIPFLLRVFGQYRSQDKANFFSLDGVKVASQALPVEVDSNHDPLSEQGRVPKDIQQRHGVRGSNPPFSVQDRVRLQLLVQELLLA